MRRIVLIALLGAVGTVSAFGAWSLQRPTSAVGQDPEPNERIAQLEQRVSGLESRVADLASQLSLPSPSAAPAQPGIVSATEFRLVDASGTQRGRFYVNPDTGNTVLFMNDQQRGSEVGIQTGSRFSGFYIVDSSGELRTLLGYTEPQGGTSFRPFLSCFDATGRLIVCAP